MLQGPKRQLQTRRSYSEREGGGGTEEGGGLVGWGGGAEEEGGGWGGGEVQKREGGGGRGGRCRRGRGAGRGGAEVQKREGCGGAGGGGGAEEGDVMGQGSRGRLGLTALGIICSDGASFCYPLPHCIEGYESVGSGEIASAM